MRRYGLAAAVLTLTACAGEPRIVYEPVATPCVTAVPDVQCPAWPEPAAADVRAGRELVGVHRVRIERARAAHRVCASGVEVLAAALRRCAAAAEDR